jgi:hypothetical protein
LPLGAPGTPPGGVATAAAALEAEGQHGGNGVAVGGKLVPAADGSATGSLSLEGSAALVAADESAAPATMLDEDPQEEQMEEEYRNALLQRRAAEVERRRREAEEAERVRGAAEFQELVAYVLEGTLFNLVSEVSLGEFPLETVPRQIVRSLEITQDVPNGGER